MNVVARHTRMESVRFLVQEMIAGIPCERNKQAAAAHLHGVSTFAAMLATKRQCNQELAAIAGLLHGYYEYRTDIRDFPGPNSAEAVRPLLRDTKQWSKEDQTTILQAIFYHAHTDRVFTPYEAIVADACLLHHYFHHLGSDISPYDAPRLETVLQQLGMTLSPVLSQEPATPDTDMPIFYPDRCNRLADFAEELAGQQVVGVRGDQQYREICKYWPDADIYLVLRDSWCAAFVYHCCWEVGISLPIRYPNGIHRFAGAGAWVQWAQLPETGFFYRDMHLGFTPQRGDIVIYDKLLSDQAHDHIGIVLGCNGDEIRVAEGNAYNQNVSSVYSRDRYHCICGYIRIDSSYVYHYNGDYIPILS